MKKNSGPIHTGVRSSTKVKQRKTNRIYNISITVVIVLILIVGGSILFSKDETKQASTAIKEDAPKQTEKSDAKTSKVEDEDQDQDITSETDDSNDAENQDATEEQGPEETGQDDSTVILGSEDENDVNSDTSDTSESVGTTQSSNPEVTNFDKGSTNWAKMESAVAQGAGISTDNMTVLWLGNGGGPGKAVGTVSAKDTKQVYKVNIEWVEGTGWKPVKVEKK